MNLAIAAGSKDGEGCAPVMGAGAMGSFAGGMLGLRGHDATFVALDADCERGGHGDPLAR